MKYKARNALKIAAAVAITALAVGGVAQVTDGFDEDKIRDLFDNKVTIHKDLSDESVDGSSYNLIEYSETDVTTVTGTDTSKDYFVYMQFNVSDIEDVEDGYLKLVVNDSVVAKIDTDNIREDGTYELYAEIDASSSDAGEGSISVELLQTAGELEIEVETFVVCENADGVLSDVRKGYVS